MQTRQRTRHLRHLAQGQMCGRVVVSSSPAQGSNPFVPLQVLHSGEASSVVILSLIVVCKQFFCMQVIRLIANVTRAQCITCLQTMQDSILRSQGVAQEKHVSRQNAKTVGDLNSFSSLFFFEEFASSLSSLDDHSSEFTFLRAIFEIVCMACFLLCSLWASVGTPAFLSPIVLPRSAQSEKAPYPADLALTDLLFSKDVYTPSITDGNIPSRCPSLIGEKTATSLPLAL